jgi:hypothetical protein
MSAFPKYAPPSPTAGQTGPQTGNTDTDDQSSRWKPSVGNKNLQALTSKARAAMAKSASARTASAKGTPSALSVAFDKAPASPNVAPRTKAEQRTFGPLVGY